MSRNDRPGRRAPAVPLPPDVPEDDITAATRTATQGTQDTRSRITRRQRGLVLGVLAALVLGLFANGLVSYVLASQIGQQAVAQAEDRRLNGVAQDQARNAYDAAMPAAAALAARGLPELPIPRVNEAPAFRVISASASAQVLADMDPAAIRRGDLDALTEAVDRYFARGPLLTSSGPSRVDIDLVTGAYVERVAAERSPR